MNNTIYFHFFSCWLGMKKKVKCYFIFLTRFLLNLSFSPFNDSPFYYFHDNIFSNETAITLLFFLLCFIYHTIAIKQRGFLAGLVSLKGKAREEERFKTEGRRKINRKKTFRASACNDLNYKCFSALMLSTSSKKNLPKTSKNSIQREFFLYFAGK